jgi:hypothetical protein
MAKRRSQPPKAAGVFPLSGGRSFVVEIHADEHGGEIITHCIRDARQRLLGTKTCTCTCNGKSASKECDDGTNAVCDCSDPSNPKITC